MRQYNLKLVRVWPSVLLMILVIFAALAVMILLALAGRELSKTSALTMIISFLLGFIYLLWKYYDRLLIKYNQIAPIDDDFFCLDTVKYKWADFEWFRNDDSSGVLNSFSIKFKGGKSLKFHVTKKKSKELDNWKSRKEDILITAKEEVLQIKNYYNTRTWRRVARILLASSVVISLIIFSLDLNISLSILLKPLLMWIGISVSFAINIFMNQKVKPVH